VVLVPSSFHDATEGPLKRPNSALFDGFWRRRAPLVVPAPRRYALLPKSHRKASIRVFITVTWYNTLVYWVELAGHLNDIDLASIGHNPFERKLATLGNCMRSKARGSISKFLATKSFPITFWTKYSGLSQKIATHERNDCAISRHVAMEV